ncbi:MAG: hypothetical protein ACPK7O_07930 [Methanobacterium sp.]
MPREGWKKLPKIKLLSLPKDIKIPDDIPASKVRIPSTYMNGEVEYEDENGNQVTKNEATHLRFTGKDRRSDVVVGPVRPRGMIKLNLYLDKNNYPVVKEKSSKNRTRVLSEDYRPIK